MRLFAGTVLRSQTNGAARVEVQANRRGLPSGIRDQDARIVEAAAFRRPLGEEPSLRRRGRALRDGADRPSRPVVHRAFRDDRHGDGIDACHLHPELSRDGRPDGQPSSRPHGVRVRPDGSGRGEVRHLDVGRGERGGAEQKIGRPTVPLLAIGEEPLRRGERHASGAVGLDVAAPRDRPFGDDRRRQVVVRPARPASGDDRGLFRLDARDIVHPHAVRALGREHVAHAHGAAARVQERPGDIRVEDQAGIVGGIVVHPESAAGHALREVPTVAPFAGALRQASGLLAVEVVRMLGPDGQVGRLRHDGDGLLDTAVSSRSDVDGLSTVGRHGEPLRDDRPRGVREP